MLYFKFLCQGKHIYEAAVKVLRVNIVVQLQFAWGLKKDYEYRTSSTKSLLVYLLKRCKKQ